MTYTYTDNHITLSMANSMANLFTRPSTRPVDLWRRDAAEITAYLNARALPDNLGKFNWNINEQIIDMLLDRFIDVVSKRDKIAAMNSGLHNQHMSDRAQIENLDDKVIYLDGEHIKALDRAAAAEKRASDAEKGWAETLSARNKAEEPLAELYRAASAILKHGYRSRKVKKRLSEALAAAEPHIDFIPF